MNIIFFASGFAGLIYESIWTHYLKLFLGHAAYAQTVVLGIFMGGMAIGAAIAAKRTAHIRNPLRVYAGIEAIIGVFAIGFHFVFTSATDGFYTLALDQALSGTPLLALKWGLAAALILPQSILLGATFPMFAAAATRASASNTGRSIATLYFANSIGGATGILMSGFILIPSLGLPGTISAAGGVNFLIAIVAAKMSAVPAQEPARAATAGPVQFGRLCWLLVTVSFLTGATSFIYEIGWIRMLSLVLGSATRSFELMLCAFITGLALGGFWVRKRIDTSANPGVMLGYVQIAMGCAAIATIPLHSASFDFIAWVVRNAPKTDGGYSMLNLVRYGISSLIMFPAAFCAGMTLPLATRVLHSEQQQGEKAIGIIYSANTIGAIAGLAFAVHVGLPAFGLEYLVASGALVDVILGVALLMVFAGRKKLLQSIAAVVTCAVGTVAAATTFNPQKIVSGPIRTGKVSIPGTVTEVAHGRTATISVDKKDAIVSIRTNGKTDASATTVPSSGYVMDEVTMTLIGVIPLSLHDKPLRVANIGFGSGITGETILGDPRVAQLDTIEIEPKMVELARHFTGLNRQVYEDPRSAIHIDDAKSFFASNGQTYDLIVSEPSNPWVSGVSGLFSVEFYRHASRYLREGGMLAQWIQIYETHPDRIASILKALDQAFDDYIVVALDNGDIMVIAKPHGKIVMPSDAYSRLSAELQKRLRRLEIAGQADLTIRVVGNKSMFKPWLAARAVPANSDFAPYLDDNADYDRFMNKGWADVYRLAMSAYPIAEILGGRPPFDNTSTHTMNPHFGDEPPAVAARSIKENLFGNATGSQTLPVPLHVRNIFQRKGEQLIADCRTPPMGDGPYASAAIAINVLPYLSPAESRAVLEAMGDLPCLSKLDGNQSLWAQLLRQVADRNAKGFGETAEQLLENGQGTTETRGRYLLGMAMLGHLGDGNQVRAKLLWEKFAAKVLGDKPPGLSLELLRDHALYVDRTARVMQSAK